MLLMIIMMLIMLLLLIMMIMLLLLLLLLLMHHLTTASIPAILTTLINRLEIGRKHQHNLNITSTYVCCYNVAKDDAAAGDDNKRYSWKYIFQYKCRCDYHRTYQHHQQQQQQPSKAPLFP